MCTPEHCLPLADSDGNLKTKAEGNQTTDNSTADDENEQKKAGEQVHLTARLPPDDFARLKETATGLHCKVPIPICHTHNQELLVWVTMWTVV